MLLRDDWRALDGDASAELRAAEDKFVPARSSLFGAARHLLLDVAQSGPS